MADVAGKTVNRDSSTTSYQDESSDSQQELEKNDADVIREDPAPDEYPHGFRLVILVVAVNLALFLASLDQVGDGL